MTSLRPGTHQEDGHSRSAVLGTLHMPNNKRTLAVWRTHRSAAVPKTTVSKFYAKSGRTRLPSVFMMSKTPTIDGQTQRTDTHTTWTVHCSGARPRKQTRNVDPKKNCDKERCGRHCEHSPIVTHCVNTTDSLAGVVSKVSRIDGHGPLTFYVTLEPVPICDFGSTTGLAEDAKASPSVKLLDSSHSLRQFTTCQESGRSR